MSTLRYAPQVISDAIAELNSRQNNINSLTSQVNSLTSQVNTLTGQVNTLTVDLDNVYDVIVDNTVGVVVVEESTDQYGVYCQNIIDAYDVIVANKDTIISARNTTISTYEGYFSDICDNIGVMGGTVPDPVVYANIADYVLTIPQSSSPSAYIGYLNDIYTVISANNQSVVITSGDYQNFDTNIQDIFDSYDGEVSGLSSQVSTLTSTVNAYVSDFADIASAITAMGGTVGSGGYSDYDDYVRTIPTSAQLQAELDAANALLAQYRAYFSDIATSISNKGGTVVDPYAYDDFDDYINGIPTGGQTVDQGIIAFGNLKTQILEIDVQGTDSAHSNAQINLWGDMTNAFRGMGHSNRDSSPFYNGVKLNLSGLTNATDMFGHVTDDGQGNLSIDTYLNSLPELTGGIGVNYQGDLSIDLRCFGSVDMDGWKNTIPTNNTGYVREIILRTANYNDNVNWGGVARLRAKHYTVTDGGETRP